MPYKDKEKNLQYHRDYWKKNPRQVRDRKFRKEFGISLDDYEELLVKQNGVCAICFQPETAVHAKAKRVQNLAVDHNHENGKVRGLLCSTCNTALGLLKEDPQRLLSMLSCLSRHAEVD